MLLHLEGHQVAKPFVVHEINEGVAGNGAVSMKLHTAMGAVASERNTVVDSLMNANVVERTCLDGGSMADDSDLVA